MTITAAGLAGGNNGNSTTSVARTLGSVTAGQLVVIWGMKFSPTTVDAFVAADCTQSGGTARIGPVSLDMATGGFDGNGNASHSGIWSCIVLADGTLTMQIGGALASSFLLTASEAFGGNWDASRVEGTNGAMLDTDATGASSTGNVTSAGAAIFAAALQLNSTAATTITPDAAFTTVYENETGTDDNGSAIYRIVTTGTTDAGDWTHGTTHQGAATSLVVYRESLSTPAGTNNTRQTPQRRRSQGGLVMGMNLTEWY